MPGGVLHGRLWFLGIQQCTAYRENAIAAILCAANAGRCAFRRCASVLHLRSVCGGRDLCALQAPHQQLLQFAFALAS